MELGRKIYHTRETKNISKKSLAKKIGVSTSILNKWENCEMIPDMKQVNKLAEALDITVAELLDNDIRNLFKEDYNTADNNKDSSVTDLLKIVGVIILILVILLFMFYM